MERVPEPELMDDPAQAQAYAAADFAEPHAAFVRYFRERFPDHVARRVFDLGCGPADVTLRFLAAFPAARALAVDGAAPMLALARAAAERAGLGARIDLMHAHLPAPLPDGFDTVLSNSLLHHLADPLALWRQIAAAGARGAAVLIMDLRRPATRNQAQALVDAYASTEPEVLKRDFLQSLCAAYTAPEIGRQLRQAGLTLAVEAIGDRHVLVHGRLP